MIRDKARLRADGLAYLTGQSSALPRPVAVGAKFTPGGQVLAFGGNTFLCHIPQSSRAHAALCTASAALQGGPVAGAYAFLPPSSFHMTVFEGVTHARRDAANWPQDLDPALPVAEVTDHFAARVATLSLPAQAAIRPTGLFGGFSLAVTGASDADEASLRGSRAALRAATGILRPDFASYGFHITLAYLLRWLTPAEAEAALDHSEQVFEAFVQAVPQIDLGRIEFCRFDDMFAFHPLARL